MKYKNVVGIFFSPTKGTKKYIETLAKSLSSDAKIIDLTLSKARDKEYKFDKDDLVVFGAPVYYGRLPTVVAEVFDKIKGCSTPAIFNVVYGNREFEDALLEEKVICENNGFIGIAAGVWVAPHTFSDKIAAGRPDSDDLNDIKSFAEKLKQMDISSNAKLSIPGSFPYREFKPLPIFPTGDDKCTDCGICAIICPVGAINEKDLRETDGKKCIDCFACVKFCPPKARSITEPMFGAIQSKLEATLANVRKESLTFFAE